MFCSTPSRVQSEDAEIVLAVGNAVFRGLAEPLCGGGVVRLALDAFGIEHGEVVHGLGVALAGGGHIELARGVRSFFTPWPFSSMLA